MRARSVVVGDWPSARRTFELNGLLSFLLLIDSRFFSLIIHNDLGPVELDERGIRHLLGERAEFGPAGFALALG